MNFAPQMADADALRARNEKLQTDLYTKAGEVANLRQRLVGFEKDIAKLRDEKHTLLQQQQASGRGSAPGPGAGSSRDAARAKELEKEVATIRSKLEFRDNDNQKMIRRVTELENVNAEKDRVLQEHSNQRNAMERELQQLRDNLEQQRQNLELERVQQEARARELEQREKQLEQERQVDQARTSEGEVGQKRGRDADPQHDVGSRGLLRRDGGLEGSAKQAAKPGDEDDVNCRRTAGSGLGKDIGSGKDVKREDERPGAQRRGMGNLDARGDEADMLPPARDSGDTSEWAVKMERTDRSAVLTNTSAERLRIVKALLAGWGGDEQRDGLAETSARFRAGGLLTSGLRDGEVGGQLAGSGSGCAGATAGKDKEAGVGNSLGLFLDGAAPVEALLHDLQGGIVDAVHVHQYKSERGLQRVGTVLLQQRAASQLAKSIPALASLLTVSPACRTCMLEETIREYYDTDLVGPEVEDAGEGSSERTGRRRVGGGSRAGASIGAARDGVGGANARGGASACGASLRPSMSGFQGSMGSGDAAGAEKPSRSLMLLVADLLSSWVQSLMKTIDKPSRDDARRGGGKLMALVGLAGPSATAEEALIVRCLEILRLLLESCKKDQLGLVAEILNLKGHQGVGDQICALLEHEAVSLSIKAACLALLAPMVSCTEFRHAVCPDIGEDEDLDGLGATSSEIPVLLSALTAALQYGVALTTPRFTQRETPCDSEMAWKVCHAALRIFAQLCTINEVDWVQTLLRRTGSQSFQKAGYPCLQVLAGDLIVHEVRRLGAAAAPRRQAGAPRGRQAQPLLLREAVSLLWMLVVASHEGDCTRVSGFWKPGAWMPLLAALRRLENGAVCPGLDDLKKSSTSMAAHLSRDCMLEEGEGMGGEDTQWGTADGTLTMHEGSSIGLI